MDKYFFDPVGGNVEIDRMNNMVRFCGLPICTFQIVSGEIVLIFKDRSKIRAGARGTPYIGIRAKDLLDKISESA